MRLRRLSLTVLLSLAMVAGLVACDPATKVQVRAGTNEITVTTAPRARVALYDRRGVLVPTADLTDPMKPVMRQSRWTDGNGNLVIRNVPSGSGFTVRRLDVTTTNPSDPFTVRSATDVPNPSLYAQTLNIGYGYMATRDGTLLSYTVRLPGPPEDGPYPTVVEYSGYDPANPYDWSGTAPSQRIANLMGYAVVGVNLRGSGCSGGSFRVFEPVQGLDGYDVVETVARQPWVKGGKVGMVGLSYPGNMALFTAATRPPSLASIAVGGIMDDSIKYLLRPGGILNTGFARSWVEGRYTESQLATAPGWVTRRIAEGDTTCEANHRLRNHNVDVVRAIDTYGALPAETDFTRSMAPASVVSRIQVPVYFAHSWQDEQTNSHAASMFKDFTGTTKKHFMVTNGGHAEFLATVQMLQRWGEFLDLYVAKKVPDGSVLRLIAPFIGQQVLGSANPVAVPFPADRYTGKTYAQALASYEADPQLRVFFENGGGSDGVAAGLPHPTFARDFTAYPVPGTQAQRWYAAPGGALSPTAPTAVDGAAGTVDSYVSDPSVRPATSLPGGGEWGQLPGFAWANPVPGKALSYVSPPLTTATTMVGSGSVDLWLRSSAADTDMQVTLSEVRPDGKEILVQSGWGRASMRTLDAAKSTVLQPIGTGLESDVAPLPPGVFTPVRLEIYPFAHVFRPGSRIRVIITAPGGDRVAWSFQTLPGTPTNDIARSVGRPSSIALPVVPGVTPPPALPACPGVRGQPCRTYVPLAQP